ncbi:hypothetical protein M1N20_03305 [Dehalococcoidia bacterium]|nr:hypothetical protein [Dehalococcoidia bacterium]
MDTTKQNSEHCTIDICGKRIVDYLAECLAKFNRGVKQVTLRTVSGSESTATETAHILTNYSRFNVNASDIQLGKLKVVGVQTVSLQIPLTCQGTAGGPNIGNYTSKEGFVEFLVYHLLFDLLLCQKSRINIFRCDGTPLVSISKSKLDYICENKTVNKDTLNDLASAYYRSGLLLSQTWQRVAEVLSRFDDVVIGVDTNMLYNAAITEHILSSLTIVDLRKYVHTPNWILIIVPSAVMHEIEEATNYRDNDGNLELPGRMGYRALQEILELDSNADLTGVAVAIVGEANPMLDTRVELQGLRKDLVVIERKRGQTGSISAWTAVPPVIGRKMSSGDTIIRDQFRTFLRGLSFHKSAYFLTADKSHAALAKAEGLQALYYKTPPSSEALGSREKGTIELPEILSEPERLKLSVPIGKLIYELAVQFGSIRIQWGSESVETSCDTRAETLDHWIHRELRFDNWQLEKLLQAYSSVGRFELAYVAEVYGEICKLIEEPEL